MDERDVLLAWRQLFNGKEASSETLAEAQTLLEGLSGESPLHIRLENELAELKKRFTQRTTTQPTRRRS